MTRGLWIVLGLFFLPKLPVVGFAYSAEPDPKTANKRALELFEKKIRPVLVAECYQCHSQEAVTAGKLKGGLLLDSAAGMLAGGDSGPVLVPKSAKSSLLIHALRHEDIEMPPNKKLSDAVIRDFESWINQGAPDPRKGTADVSKTTIDVEAGRQFWSFQPPSKSSTPTVQNAAWPRSDVDHFILAGLEAQKLKPVADADRRTIARRVYFDLIGLPPTPEQVDEFVNDRSPQAFEKLVDQLLDSSHFGERWGRHWLDVARYADSNGNVDNNLFPYAWRYRDYVIKSFNADKPFDRFVTEQLAGDLLSSESPEERNDLLVATGFLALTSKPRPQNNPDFAMDLVADQIEVTTTSLMGLTVACARCHDHKFDPVPMNDYYALAGFFTSSEMLYGVMTRNNKPDLKGGKSLIHILAAVESKAAEQSVDPVELKNLQEEEAKLIQKEAKLHEALKAVGKEKKKAKNKQNEADEKAEARRAKIRLEAQIVNVEQELATARERLSRLTGDTQNPGLYAMGVRDSKRAADCQLCIRGESTKRGATVPRGFVSVVNWDSQPTFSNETSGRKELAAWLTAKRHPLTARVWVNRVWQHLFGVGLVSTPDNFGAHGERPSNQALLDTLAVQFMEHGWSTKRLIRELLLTRTYGLSSEVDASSMSVDPENRLLWRHTPRRLDAEIIRDAALFVSGSLDLAPLKGTLIEKHGSQEVRNEMGAQIARIESPHRSVYLPAVRNNAPETLESFDMADSSLVVGLRDVTTVPAQALFLMNSPFVLKQSDGFASRLLTANLDDAGRVELAYRLAFSRSSDSNERQRALKFVELMTDSLVKSDRKSDESAIRQKAWASLCQSLLASAEFRYVE